MGLWYAISGRIYIMNIFQVDEAQLLILLVDLSLKCAVAFLLHVVQAYSVVCLTRLTTSIMRSNLNDLELRYGIKWAAVLTAALL